MKYLVYFEFFGRKMKTEIEARSEEQARAIITSRVNFLKVEQILPDTPDFINWFNDIVGGKK